jgi:hypothetical protein
MFWSFCGLQHRLDRRWPEMHVCDIRVAAHLAAATVDASSQLGCYALASCTSTTCAAAAQWEEGNMYMCSPSSSGGVVG